MLMPVDIFFVYSHKDEELRDELAKHLAVLKRQHVIHEWHDRRIDAGQDWRATIDEHLERARMVLLLISADFLASDYCYDVEMKRALERQESGAALVIPVILRACDWKKAPFARLQVCPKDAKPVKSWPDRDEAWENVAHAIRGAVEKLSNP